MVGVTHLPPPIVMLPFLDHLRCAYLSLLPGLHRQGSWMRKRGRYLDPPQSLFPHALPSSAPLLLLILPSPLKSHKRPHGPGLWLGGWTWDGVRLGLGRCGARWLAHVSDVDKYSFSFSLSDHCTLVSSGIPHFLAVDSQRFYMYPRER